MSASVVTTLTDKSEVKVVSLEPLSIEIDGDLLILQGGSMHKILDAIESAEAR